MALNNVVRNISCNEASKLIKKTLQTAFPGVKFSVRLDKYSMGHSIDASWTDGPAGSQVKEILDRFESRGFDGMTDCSYECGQRTYKGERVDFNSGYVRGNRSCSPELMRAVVARLAHECGIPAPAVNNHGYMDHGQDCHVPYVWFEHWRKRPLTARDLLSTTPILAHDSHEGGGEWFGSLVNMVAHSLSLKPLAQPVELPEYIDLDATASTGRAEFEEPMAAFETHAAFTARIQ